MALSTTTVLQEFVNIIQRRRKPPARLVNDLLELSRIVSGCETAAYTADLTLEIKIIDLLKPRFRKKRLSLKAELPKASCDCAGGLRYDPAEL